MNLEPKDKPGAIKIEQMRLLFEQVVSGTAAIACNLPLTWVSKNGKFERYINEETQAAWFGFAMGLRLAQRIELAGSFIQPGTKFFASAASTAAGSRKP